MLNYLKKKAPPMVFATDLWINGRHFVIRINGVVFKDRRGQRKHGFFKKKKAGELRVH